MITHSNFCASVCVHMCVCVKELGVLGGRKMWGIINCRLQHRYSSSETSRNVLDVADLCKSMCSLPKPSQKSLWYTVAYYCLYLAVSFSWGFFFFFCYYHGCAVVSGQDYISAAVLCQWLSCNRPSLWHMHSDCSITLPLLIACF